MATYIKNQFTGNENGWHKPVKNLGTFSFSPELAEIHNAQFRNTGIKYDEKFLGDEPVDEKPQPNMEMVDGNLVEKKAVVDPAVATATSPGKTALHTGPDEAAITDNATALQPDAKPSADYQPVPEGASVDETKLGLEQQRGNTAT
jgi:hypothetical protein